MEIIDTLYLQRLLFNKFDKMCNIYLFFMPKFEIFLL